MSRRGFVSSVAPLAPRPSDAVPAVRLIDRIRESADCEPPSSNRGVSGNRGRWGAEADPEAGGIDGQTVCIDWLTWCFELPEFLACLGMGEKKARDTIGRLHHDGGNADLIAGAVLEYFGLSDAGIVMDGLPGPGRFYAFMVGLRDRNGHRCGTVEFGGEHTRRKTGAETVRVELSGRGCEQYEGRTASGAHRPRPWATLRAKLESGPSAWVTRCDLACDVYDGAWSIQHARAMYESGRFDNRGQHPIAQSIDDHGSGKGCTFYVGSPSSQKMLRVYEKGKQLGDKASAWVRWEVQLRAAGGRIPLDVITSPAAAIRGAYAALEFASETATRAHQAKQRAKATAANAVRWLKRQYGGTLGWLKKKVGDANAFAAAFDVIARDTMPAWAREPLHADEWPAVLRRALGLEPGDSPLLAA